MDWSPMSPEDACKVLDGMPAGGTTSAEQWAKYIEAWLVQDGASNERIKAAVEAVLGHPLD